MTRTMPKHAAAPRSSAKPPRVRSSGRGSEAGHGHHAGGHDDHPAHGADSYAAGAHKVKPGEGAVASAKLPRHAVKPGETLWEIAKEHLGDGRRWPTIWALNRHRLPNARMLHAGMMLVLPAGGAHEASDHAADGARRGAAAKPKAKRGHAAKREPADAAKHAPSGAGHAPAGHPPTHGAAELDPPGSMESGLNVPTGIRQIMKVFGQPGKNIVSRKMRCGPDGEMKSVSCHAKIADVLAAVFDDIHAAGKSGHIKSFNGCYNFRKKRGGSSWSTHAWGIAVDVNASANPMTSRKRGPVISGDQKHLAPFFERRGFYWGANFGDAMHFQYCKGY